VSSRPAFEHVDDLQGSGSAAARRKSESGLTARLRHGRGPKLLFATVLPSPSWRSRMDPTGRCPALRLIAEKRWGASMACLAK